MNSLTVQVAALLFKDTRYGPHLCGDPIVPVHRTVHVHYGFASKGKSDHPLLYSCFVIACKSTGSCRGNPNSTNIVKSHRHFLHGGHLLGIS